MAGVSEYESTEVHGSKDEGKARQNWYECEKDDVHFDLFATVNEIDEQNARPALLLKNARMYTNQDIMSNSPDLMSRATGVLPKNRPTYNLIKSVIDTLNSRIGKAKPRPYFLTTKGDHDKQTKAKNLQQFMDGFFDKEQIYGKSKRVFRDACLFGGGMLKFFESEGDLKVEHINPLEIAVDEIDGMYGSPRMMYQRKWIKTTVLEAKYPKFKTEIRLAATEQIRTKTMVCKVIEGWRTGPGGRRVIAIEEATLLDKDYSKKTFPFVKFTYEDALMGFWGEDLVEHISGLQVEINKIMRMISKAIELVAIPKVFMTNTASVPESSINNRIGQVIKHAAGQPPTFYTPTAMTPEVYKYLDWLIQTGYEIPGLSKMSATSEKPAGLSSGKALRTYQDIESDRFSITAQRWDEFFLSVCDKIVEEAAEVYAGNKNVNVPGEKFLATMPWDKVNMKKDEYVLRIFSTNLLPTQPAAKLEMIREMAEMGAISPDRTMEMMDMPDTDKFMDEKNGTANLTKYHVQSIIDEGKYIAPDPKVNPIQAYEIANDRFLDYLSKDDIPDERLELLSRYIEQLEEILQPKQPKGEAPPMEGMPGGEMPPMPGGEMGGMPPMPGGELPPGMPPELPGMEAGLPPGGMAGGPSPEELAMLGGQVPI